MATTAIVDLFCAAFVGITLVWYINRKDGIRSSRLLNLCLLVLLLSLVDDAMAYTLVGPSYPLALRYVINLISFLASSTLAYFYTIYLEALLKEKNRSHPWFFRIVKCLELVWFLVSFYEFVAGNLISYDANGIENLNYTYPVLLIAIEMIVLVALPVITLINRKRIGTRQSVLMCLFNIVPIISTFLFTSIEADYSYSLSAVGLVLIAVFAQKTHVDNLEKENSLQQEKSADLERIRKEQIAMMAGGVSAYIVNPKTERFQIISQNSHLAENYTSEEDFNTSFSRYIENEVYEPDRKLAAEKINVPAMVKALEDKDEYIVRYRDTSAGYPRWYEMRSVRLSDDEILYGFTDREDAINGEMLFDKMRESYFGLYYVNLDTGYGQIIKTGHPELTGEAGENFRYSDLIDNIFKGSEGDALIFLNRIRDIDYLKEYFTDKELAYNVYKSYIFGGENWVTVTGMVLARQEDGTPLLLGLGFTLLDEEASQKEEAKLQVAETLSFTNYLLEPYDSAYYINLNNLSWTAYKRPDIIEMNYPTGENYVESLGRYISDEVHPDDRAALSILLNPDELKAMLSEKPQLEIRFRKISEEKEKYLNCFVIRGAEEDQAAFGFLDITDEVNAELEQRKAMQQQLDIIGGLASEYTALYHVNLDTDDYIAYHLIDKAEDIKPFYGSFRKFTDLAHAFAGSELVWSEDRESLRSFYPSPAEVKKHMKDRKMDTMLFKRNYGGEFLWTEVTIVKCEAEQEEAHDIIVGFIEKNEEVEARTRLFRENEENERLIESIVHNYSSAFLVNPSNDTFRILVYPEKFKGLLDGYDTFTQLKELYLSKVIHPADADKMRRCMDYGTISRELGKADSFNVEYRSMVYGNLDWHEMNITRISDDEIAVGFVAKNLEIIKHRLEEKRFEENFALFLVDLDSGMLKVIKNDEHYQEAKVGETVPYTPFILKLADMLEGEPKEFYTQISDILFLKREFATEDKRTYSYRSRFIGDGNVWIDVTSYVVLRHDDGTPAMFTLGFNITDALATASNELQSRLQENMHLIGGVASGYNALYYIDIDENKLNIYALDETKYPGSRAIFEGEEKDFYKIIGGYGISEQVHPDDRHLFADFGPDWIREMLKGRKQYSMRFRAATETGYRWDEMELIKYEDIDERANSVAVGFTDRDADIRTQQAINSAFNVLGLELPPDDSINRILSIAGDFYGADRCYVFEYAADNGVFSNTYEWCSDGTEPMIDNLQDLPIEFVGGWNREFERHGAFHMDALDSEHTTEEGRAILEMQGIESLVAAPLMNGDEIVGFIGVDNPTKAKADISILEKAASVVYSEILKRKENDEEHITLGKLTDAFRSVYFADLGSDYLRAWKVAEEDKDDNELLMHYTVAMDKYLRENIAPRDRERCTVLTSPKNILEQFRTKDRFSVEMTDIVFGYERNFIFDYIKVNEDGTQFVLCSRDATETLRKEKEQQRLLEEARIAAEAANISKTSFLFNMSHDVRTPMNAITGFTKMAKKHIDDREKVSDYLEKIDTSGQQLLTLVNQVLEMARIESGKIEFEEKPVNVRDEYGAAVTVLAEQAKANGLTFHHSLSDVIHNNVLADTARMNSITLNIAGNAMKYTPRGGTVEFGLKEIPARKDGYATFVFTVADTGIGMSEEYQKVLFEPFTREKSSTVSKIQGTGLGMSIVKELVDLLGGTIEVQSELGSGTRFDITVDFRIDKDAEETVKPADTAETFDFSGRKVLLVEDNEMNREIAEELLEEAGLSVETAEDGIYAVEMMKEKGPDYYDFILMDIQMPFMNGYEATKAIRGMYPDADIPIIAVSANAFEEDRKASLEAGMNDHVSKPIVIEELFSALARFM